jgi:hypothetical protein
LITAVSKILLKFLAASALILLMAAGLNFVVDPLQLFRPARLFPAMYSADTRMQDAGLIRSQEFDTVLMGTSLAIHFRQSDIDRVLGVRALKLSMTGSSSRQQSFVLDAAMARHPKRVIWQLDDWIFHDAPDPDSDVYLPAGLFRRSAAGIAGYLFSGQMARESLWILARSLPPLQPAVARLTSDLVFKFPVADVNEINTLPPDYDVAGAYNAGKARAAFRHITDPVRNRYLADGYDYDAMVRAFERDAIGLIAKNPDVVFDIYFPPYSILQFVAMRDVSPATLKTAYDFAAYAFPRLVQYPNVRLYDFRAVKEVTHDLDNYGDVIHHSPAIDMKVLSWLADGKYAVDRAKPLAPLEQLKAQVEAYQVER